MSNTLGDSINDILRDAVEDAIRAANDRETELLDEIDELDQKVRELQDRLSGRGVLYE